MRIEGLRISIERLKLEDVYEMRQWGFHENPLIEDYNFPEINDEEIEIWYKRKTKPRKNKYYAIRNENQILIGYMGIKDIKRFRRKSTLGLVFDPNYVNQGYGTETLMIFLIYYFTEMKMKSMLLEVTEFNRRAYRLYEKIGFKSIGYYLNEFFNPYLDLSSPYYIDEKSSFEIKKGKLYNYIYLMELKKEDFMEKIEDDGEMT